METLVYVKKDFFKLLRVNTINNDLTESLIRGNGNYFSGSGFFLQKIFQPTLKHFLSIKLKFNYARKLQNLKINGKTNNERFSGSLDYYYSEENYITKGNTKSKKAYGLGYGIDIEYIYHHDKLYVYLGAFNIGSYIYWKNATFMHYDFDSNIVYEGDDGFTHSRPFGVGYYKYNVSFKQKIPHFYKTSLEYKIGNNILLGHNLNIYDSMYMNEPTIGYESRYATYKLGYVYENSEAIFSVYSKYMIFQISNKFSKDNDVIRVNLKLSY